MKTLSTNFQTVLKKGDFNQVYIIKVTGNLKTSTYTSKSFYFSNVSGVITDTINQPLLNTLYNIPNITEQLNVKAQTSSIGGFSVSIINNGFSDTIDLYNFWNREIIVYFGSTDLTNLSNFEILYTGIIGNVDYNQEIITFPVTNSTVTVQKELPLKNINQDDFSKAENNVIGMADPIVYGNHIYNLGNTDADKMTYSQANNMIKMLYVGNNQYRVAGHELKEIDSVWTKDSRTKRFIKLDGFKTIVNDSSGVTIDVGKELSNGSDGQMLTYYTFYSATSTFVTDGVSVDDWITIDNGTTSNRYAINAVTSETNLVLKTATGFTGTGYDFFIIKKDLLFYDYWHGIGGFSQEDSVWTDTEQASNGDINGNCTFDTGDSPYVVGCTAKVSFPWWDNADNIDDADIEEVTVFARSSYFADAGATFTINGASVTGNLPTTFYNCGNESSNRAGIISEVNLTVTPSLHEEVHLRVYELYKRIKYVYDPDTDFYCSCKGKEAGSTLNGLFTDITSDSQLLENPAHIMADIIVNDLEQTTLSDSFQDSATELTNWKFAFTIENFINSYELLNKLAKDCKTIIRWNSKNKPSLFCFGTYTTARTIYQSEMLNFSRVESSLSDVINKLELKYNNKKDSLEREDNRTGIGSQDVYNFISNTTVETDYITDETTAELLADFYCKNDTDSFWSGIHQIISFETPVVSHKSWQTTFKPLNALEIGDVIELDEMEMPVNDSQFLITSISRLKNKIKIIAFEL